jgi:predicted PurR-regulated permease PerM
MACHHHRVEDDASALRVDPENAAGARLRLRLDWRTFAWLVIAVLGALALIALVTNTTTMLTRIGIGLLVALALDPLVDKLQRRLATRRGVAVLIVATGIITLATLLVLVLGPRAVDEARQFSDQLPETVDQLEEMPVVGGWLRDNEVGDRAQQWVRELPDQFTDERVAELASTLVSGIAGVAIVTVLAIAVLIDGENLLGRFRRLLPAHRRPQADAIGDITYRTLGRLLRRLDHRGRPDGALRAHPGARPRHPAGAARRPVGDVDRPHPAGRRLPRRLVPRAPRHHPGRAGGARRRRRVRRVHELENHLIQPAIVGRSVDLTPPTTMVAAFVGGAIAGIPGALVATPFVGAAKAVYLEARGRSKPQDDHAGGLLARLRRLRDRGD